MNVSTAEVAGNNMRMETKFLRLRTPVELGSRFGDWSVCWLGGWGKPDVLPRDAGKAQATAFHLPARCGAGSDDSLAGRALTKAEKDKKAAAGHMAQRRFGV
jgi:hypothetical protein